MGRNRQAEGYAGTFFCTEANHDFPRSARVTRSRRAGWRMRNPPLIVRGQAEHKASFIYKHKACMTACNPRSDGLSWIAWRVARKDAVVDRMAATTLCRCGSIPTMLSWRCRKRQTWFGKPKSFRKRKLWSLASCTRSPRRTSDAAEAPNRSSARYSISRNAPVEHRQWSSSCVFPTPPSMT
jgi:hypothetical protein